FAAFAFDSSYHKLDRKSAPRFSIVGFGHIQSAQGGDRVATDECAGGDERGGGQEKVRINVGTKCAVFDTALQRFPHLAIELRREIDEAVARCRAVLVKADAFLGERA